MLSSGEKRHSSDSTRAGDNSKHPAPRATSYDDHGKESPKSQPRSKHAAKGDSFSSSHHPHTNTKPSHGSQYTHRAPNAKLSEARSSSRSSHPASSYHSLPSANPKPSDLRRAQGGGVAGGGATPLHRVATANAAKQVVEASRGQSGSLKPYIRGNPVTTCPPFYDYPSLSSTNKSNNAGGMICRGSHRPNPSALVSSPTAVPNSVASQAAAIRQVATTQASRFPAAASGVMSNISCMSSRSYLDTRAGPIETMHETPEDIKQATRMTDLIDRGKILAVLSARPGTQVAGTGLTPTQTDNLRCWIGQAKEKLGYLCPGVAKFYRYEPGEGICARGGWECGGKNHFLPDASLATGMSMMYVSPTALEAEGFSRERDPDVWAHPPPGEGIPQGYRGPITKGLSVDRTAGRIVWKTTD